MNAVVKDNCQIASRLLEDSIEIVIELPAPEPAWIKADPAQD